MSTRTARASRTVSDPVPRSFCSTSTTTRKACLGPDTEHTVYEGELYGVNMALDLLITLLRRQPETRALVILLDNHAAIRCSSSPRAKPGQLLAQAAFNSARQLHTEVPRLCGSPGSQATLTFQVTSWRTSSPSKQRRVLINLLLTSQGFAPARYLRARPLSKRHTTPRSSLSGPRAGRTRNEADASHSSTATHQSSPSPRTTAMSLAPARAFRSTALGPRRPEQVLAPDQSRRLAKLRCLSRTRIGRPLHLLMPPLPRATRRHARSARRPAFHSRTRTQPQKHQGNYCLRYQHQTIRALPCSLNPCTRTPATAPTPPCHPKQQAPPLDLLVNLSVIHLANVSLLDRLFSPDNLAQALTTRNSNVKRETCNVFLDAERFRTHPARPCRYRPVCHPPRFRSRAGKSQD